MNINNVVIAGRISRDIELKYLPSGKAIGDFSVCLTEKWGENEETCFIDVTAWEKNAENISKHFSKGDEIGIVGRLKQDSWEDKSTGQKRTKIKIVCSAWSFGQKKKADGNQPQSAANSGNQRPASKHHSEVQVPQDDDDESIPF